MHKSLQQDRTKMFFFALGMVICVEQQFAPFVAKLFRANTEKSDSWKEFNQGLGNLAAL